MELYAKSFICHRNYNEMSEESNRGSATFWNFLCYNDSYGLKRKG